jgi:hypothetical protein
MDVDVVADDDPYGADRLINPTSAEEVGLPYFVMATCIVELDAHGT